MKDDFPLLKNKLKKIIKNFFFLFFPASGLLIAQNNTELFPQKDLLIPYHSEWTKNHYKERIEVFKNDPLNFNEIVFIGNSITEGGKNWSEKFNIPNIRNRGIGGDVTDGVLERLDEIILNQRQFLF